MVLLSVTGLLVLAAFVIAILAGINRAPLWVAVLLLALAQLVQLGLR